MPHNIPHEALASNEPLRLKDALQSLGIAVLVVSAVFVTVWLLMMPVRPL